MTKKWWQPQYKRQADLIEEIRGQINSARLNQPLGPANEAFFLWVLSHHHEFEEKRGCGIRHLEVRENWFHGKATRGLWIVRTDGSEIDISWRTAIKQGGAMGHEANVKAAARHEVADQIEKFRASSWIHLGELCELCSEPLLQGQLHHVDHIEPFDELLRDFVCDDYSLIQLKDKGLYGEFACRGMAAQWSQYHAYNAKLRLVHAVCNLRRGKK
ncbi:uncharacterized protein DUF3223 [Modicisalibacter xianhensis]|uniref:Uncharacterized protein DUF3223 n=1 Tax=Modicisalibacter xianhensis TaxID=442341 RepID=A0A4R8F8S5_9GAMM|nr:DCL family protein [Halomonas xianhensis]TDX21602.1 uncharacterized protein DUF3223 [Halomonas xianhensis]